MPEGAPMPLPDPPEKHLLGLVEAQARRIDSQAGEIERLGKRVESLQKDKLEAQLKADERPFKYSQLRLEAQLGLWKVVAASIAGVVVAALLFALVWFRHAELAELLRAARQAAAVPVAAVPAAAGASATAGPGPAPGGAAGSDPKQALTDKPR
jgi:hypothetical protein